MISFTGKQKNFFAPPIKTKAASLGRTREIIASIFILLFVYTAVSKLTDQTKFHEVLFSSPLIHSNANFLVISIPVAELCTASLLFFPFTRKTGLLFSMILMIAFTIYIFYMLVFAPRLPCSCGGVIGFLSWKQHLVFNLFFIGLAAYGRQIEKRKNFLLQ